MRFRGPPASPTRVGAATRPLRCPLRGRIGSLAATARDLGWQKSSQVKVFCPAFLQKSGRGPGAEPWPRAAARGTPLVLMKRRRGLKGEPSPGVPPLRAALPPAARATSWGRRSSGAGRGWNPAPTRGWRNAVRSAVISGKGRRGRRPLRRVGDGRVPHNMPRVYPTPGQGSAERGGAGKNRDGGTSRTPSPTGRVRVGRGCVNGYAQASVTQKPVGAGVPDDPLFRRPRGKNKQYNE